jgi:UDP-N-acetylglucosamine 2-epimerase (non-hydrolysing)
MKIVTIVGARPQFIKCAPVSRELRKEHTEILVHTGQHYDPEMSEVFFNELEIPRPDYNLCVGSGLHGKQTGDILMSVETVLLKEKPDLMLVYGDTNSTLAGALAAAKLHIPVAHIEAGLRSFDRTMPEEINRIVTDHLSDLLFCPTETAVKNLAVEGITMGVHLVGDVMADALLFNREIAQKTSPILETLGLKEKKYLVLTIHRASNTNNRQNLTNIIHAVGESRVPVVFPVHPRTRKYLLEYGLIDRLPVNIIVIDPLGYLEMIRLMAGACKLLTDSGGMQKEAYMLGVPCITLRENTEWIETLHDGWNTLAGSNEEKIISSLQATIPTKPLRDLYPTGAAYTILKILKSNIFFQRTNL